MLGINCQNSADIYKAALLDCITLLGCLERQNVQNTIAKTVMRMQENQSSELSNYVFSNVLKGLNVFDLFLLTFLVLLSCLSASCFCLCGRYFLVIVHTLFISLTDDILFFCIFLCMYRHCLLRQFSYFSIDCNWHRVQLKQQLWRQK